MLGFFKRLFGRHEPPAPQFTPEQEEHYYKLKEAALQALLGPMHDMVGHAIIPFAVGGPVDMYYFPHGLPGTAFATMELLGPDGRGPKPNRLGTYELVAFTRLPLPDPAGQARMESDTPFGRMELRMRSLLTSIARYSFDAVLNPGETAELPGDDDDPPACLLFDEYRKDGRGLRIGERQHCLLLCMEVKPSELAYAREHGTAKLLEKLKAAGAWPYSDLDREAVV